MTQDNKTIAIILNAPSGSGKDIVAHHLSEVYGCNKVDFKK